MNDITTLVTLGALASGYICFSVGHFTRYRMATLPWEQRLFESALLGGVLFSVSRLVVVPMFWAFPDLHQWSVVDYYKEALPFRFSGTLLITVIFAIALGFFQNYRINPFDAIVRANARFGNALRYEIVRAMMDSKFLMLKLYSGKIIVGLVVRGPGFEKEKTFILILPLLEGYESVEGQQIFTKSYHDVYENLGVLREGVNKDFDLEKFNIAVDFDEIESGRLFDISNYIDINADSSGESKKT